MSHGPAVVFPWGSGGQALHLDGGLAIDDAEIGKRFRRLDDADPFRRGRAPNSLTQSELAQNLPAGKAFATRQRSVVAI